VTKTFLESMDEQRMAGDKIIFRKNGIAELDKGGKTYVLVEEAHYEGVKDKLRDFFRKNVFENPITNAR